MTTTNLDPSEVNSYDYLIVGGGTAVSLEPAITSQASSEKEYQTQRCSGLGND